MTYYLYSSHLGGGVYWTSDEEYKPQYCESCGDIDWFEGTFETVDDLINLLQEIYDEEYIDEIVSEFEHEQFERGIGINGGQPPYQPQ